MGRGRRVSAGAPHVLKPRPPGGGRVVTSGCGGCYMGMGMDMVPGGEGYGRVIVGIRLVNGWSVVGQLLISEWSIAGQLFQYVSLIFNWFSKISGQVGRVLRRSG